MKSSFTSRQLEVLLAVTECGGFAAAGRALGISQPAVTKQIRAIEAKVGYPLFRVSSGSVPHLTPRGAHLVGMLPELVERFRSAFAEDPPSEDSTSVVHICCGDVISERICSLIPELRQLFPDVLIDIRHLVPSVSAAFRIQDSDIDLVYFTMRARPPPKMGTVIATLRERLYIPAHLPENAGLADGDWLPFLSAPEKTTLSRDLEFSMRSAGYHKIRVVARVQTDHERRNLGLAGIGAMLSISGRTWELAGAHGMRLSTLATAELFRSRFVNPRRASDRNVQRIEQFLTPRLREP